MTAPFPVVISDVPAVVPAATPPAASQHPALVYLATLSEGSRRAQRTALDTIAAILTDGHADHLTLPWHQLRFQHTAAVRAVLAERYAPATANRHLSALRGVLRTAWRLNLIGADDNDRASDLDSVRGNTLPAGRALSAGELRALFEATAADPTPAGPRDAALLGLLYGAGLRRSEAVALDLADYTPETGELRILGSKGGRSRTVWAVGGLHDALTAWCEARGHDTGPLLTPVRKGGKVVIARLTGQAVLYRVARRAAQAGVGGCSPHDLRRTFVGDLLDNGADIVTVSQLAGHASVTTTARYDRRPDRQRKQAAELLHVPYHR